jgi:membrane-associated HD superfamily phosphohydrolase
LAKEVQMHAAAVIRAHQRMSVLTVRDVGATYLASPVSAALLVGLPPAVLESKADIANDKHILELLKPEHGMPQDVKLEARVSSISRVARQ